MKSICHTFSLLTLIAVILLNSPALFAGNNDNDSIHTIEYIQSISISEPHRALRLIDEAEELRRLPQYSLDKLRAIVYQNGLSMYRSALIYALKVYQNDSIRHYPNEMLLTFRMLTGAYHNTGNYTESIRYAIEGIELARQRNDKEFEAIYQLYIAINKRDMGLKKEAEPYLAESARLMEQAADGSRVARTVDGLIYIYAMIVTFAYEDNEYQKAIDLLPRYLRLLEQFKDCTHSLKGRYEMRLTSLYIMYASVFAADGQMDKAEEYYRKFDAMEYAHTGDGNQMRFEYLVTTRRYREALRFIRADKEYYRTQGDTVNYSYVDRTLRFEAESHMGLGDYKAAAQTYKQMYDLSDSLRIREKQNGVLEYATIYETKEKEAQIAEQAARLRESHLIVLFAGCVIALLGVLLWRIVRHFRIVKAKNAAMVRTIREQLAYKDELFRREEELRALREEMHTKAEAYEAERQEAERRKAHEAKAEDPAEAATQPATPATAVTDPDTDESTDEVMRELFARAEYEIISRQLYLQPDFSKEELLKIVHIPKNRFAGLFKEYAGTTFLQYVNKLRMEHAARMLSDCPNYTVEAIAQACGITNVRTFYRLFFDTFRVTPNDFRAVK